MEERKVYGNQSECRVKTGYFVYLLWLGLWWNVGAMHKVQCAMCGMQTLLLIRSAKFFQHLLQRCQQTSHQTPTLYPPLQMIAKWGWIKHLPQWFTAISCNFLSVLKEAKGLESLWHQWDFLRLWVGCLRLNECDGRVCFVPLWVPILRASRLEWWIKSRVVIG